ncbi:unnamed protein product, partial [Thlaspi arvense]
RRLFSVSQRSSSATSFVLSRDHTLSDGGDSSPAPRSVPSADLSCFNSYHRSLIRGFSSQVLTQGNEIGFGSEVPATVEAVKTPNSKIVYDDHNHERYPPGDPSKRAFAYFVLSGGRFVYASVLRLLVLKLIVSMSASKDVLALASLEVDLGSIEPGTTVTVKWRGKPVFIRRRTEDDIKLANSVDLGSLRDPQEDSVRVKNPEWLIVVGVCTHLGCIPLPNAGDYGGWFCPCHGSHYDISGRIRKGPAPYNLEVPTYSFLEENKLLIAPNLTLILKSYRECEPLDDACEYNDGSILVCCIGVPNLRTLFLLEPNPSFGHYPLSEDAASSREEAFRSSTATSFSLSRVQTLFDGGDSSSSRRSVASTDLSSFYSDHRNLIRGFSSQVLTQGNEVGFGSEPATVEAVKTPNSKIVYDDHNHERYPPGDPSKRAFAYFVLSGGRFVYASVLRLLVLKLVVSMSASKDVLALASLEVDLGSIEPGTTVTVKWRGKPVFIRRRTEDDIKLANSVDLGSLRDPQEDSVRVKNPEWLVVVGVCTHLGCIPLPNAGDYGGWFCPCHGSHYDISGRIRKGPAPYNLEVPTYSFLEENKLLIG